MALPGFISHALKEESKKIRNCFMILMIGHNNKPDVRYGEAVIQSITKYKSVNKINIILILLGSYGSESCSLLA